MKPKTTLAFALIIILFWSCKKDVETPVIYHFQNAHANEQLAAKELRRYIYLRTDELPEIREVSKLPDDDQKAIIVATAEDLKNLEANLGVTDSLGKLKNDGFYLRSLNSSRLLIAGKKAIGTLYGAYHFIEHSLGVGFYLHGDALPDEKLQQITLSGFDKIHNPLFRTRGILPFHDFPEGPDWWSVEQYKAILAQLTKMKMNFVGLHTYPEGGPNAEPTVWIGQSEDHEEGEVQYSYPSSYQSTIRGNWGYATKLTKNYHFGAHQLFERDSFSSPVMNGYIPYPENQKESNELFNKTGSMFNEAFSFAHDLGIKTCVGTETPLTIPEAVKERLKRQGKDPSDPNTIKNLYKGMFERIQHAYPADYYWLWTDEGWTWNQVEQQQIESVKQDLNMALEAIKEVNPGFRLATCGWVLGPPQDRTLFDKILPKSIPLSCINREVGFTPVDTNFAKIHDRPKWAIPWLEDDPAMISPQLWAGRMRNDALDAREYGCTGLIGIHWRTKILSPNIAALADAAWNQRGWEGDTRTKRDQPVNDFYRKWATRQFGAQMANELADIFAGLDGGPLYNRNSGEGRSAHLYRTSTWINGPGAIKKTGKPWKAVQKNFTFIDTLEGYRSKIKGVNNRARFDYWLNTFRFARETAHLGCLLGKMDSLVNDLSKLKNDAARKSKVEESILPRRIEAAKTWEKMYEYLLKTVNTNGTMGTIANLEQHNLKELNMLSQNDSIIKTFLDGKLPDEATLSHNYQGPFRIIVPAKRSLLEKNEDFNLKVRMLSQRPINKVELYWKPLGGEEYRTKSFQHLNRNVYKTTINSNTINQQDFEYYIKASEQSGEVIYFPANAEKINQTVLIN